MANCHNQLGSCQRMCSTKGEANPSLAACKLAGGFHGKSENHIWANYHISLTWIVAAIKGDDFPISKLWFPGFARIVSSLFHLPRWMMPPCWGYSPMAWEKPPHDEVLAGVETRNSVILGSLQFGGTFGDEVFLLIEVIVLEIYHTMKARKKSI